MQTKPTVRGVTNTQRKILTTARRKVAGNVAHVERNGDTVRGKQIWECEKCKVSVTLYVPPTTPPTHRCRKATNQTKQLTQKGVSK